MNAVTKNTLAWYRIHHRNLPWRRTSDPYKILVSEVMLQQTQVERVIPKYKEWLKQFPTVDALANAGTGDVIRAWAGLGYNRRALFLQCTAQAIRDDYKGEFPNDLDTLKTLPGVGDYTARAILSFAFQRPVPMMDTNHRRFYQRVFFGLRMKTDKQLLKKAYEVITTMTPPAPSPRRGGTSSVATQSISKKSPPPEPVPSQVEGWGRRGGGHGTVYDWNQALMDFGSLVCLSGRPRCEICPIQKWCKAYPAVITKTQKHTRLSTSRSTSAPLRRWGTHKLGGQGKHKNTLMIPFRETDRYFRGRILDLLRQHGSLAERVLQKQFAELLPERQERLLVDLCKEGLILRHKKRILLP